jgi:hypothetical protein
VRSVRNLSDQRADYGWDVGGLWNPKLEVGKVDKKCDTHGSVANPTKPGPIAVNYQKPDGATQVWKSTDEGAQATAAPASFPEFTTVLETHLYTPGGVARPLKLAVASSVQRAGATFQYRYAITRRAGGDVPYALAWRAAESSPFVQQLQKQGLTTVDISKLGNNEPFQITFATAQAPRRVEGPLTLTQMGGDHVFTASVVTWVPQLQ